LFKRPLRLAVIVRSQPTFFSGCPTWYCTIHRQGKGTNPPSALVAVVHRYSATTGNKSRRKHMSSASRQAPRPRHPTSLSAASTEKQSHLRRRPRADHDRPTFPDVALRGSHLTNSFHSEPGDQPERFALAEPMCRRQPGGQLPCRTRLQCRLLTTGAASGRAEPASARLRCGAPSPSLDAACRALAHP
jgi:hypothetical protein